MGWCMEYKETFVLELDNICEWTCEKCQRRCQSSLTTNLQSVMWSPQICNPGNDSQTIREHLSKKMQTNYKSISSRFSWGYLNISNILWTPRQFSWRLTILTTYLVKTYFFLYLIVITKCISVNGDGMCRIPKARNKMNSFYCLFSSLLRRS